MIRTNETPSTKTEDSVVGSGADDDDYDEVAGDSSDDEDDNSMRMKYRIAGVDGGGLNGRDEFATSSPSTVSPTTSERSSSSGGSKALRRASSPQSYLSRMVKSRQRSHVASTNDERDPVLVNMKLYHQSGEMTKTESQNGNGNPLHEHRVSTNYNNC